MIIVKAAQCSLFLWHDFIHINLKASYMKKITAVFAFSFFLMVSCADQANSGNGNNSGDSKSNADRSTVPNDRTTPPATPPQEYSGPPSQADEKALVKDTPRTSVSVGKDGASVKTKKGTGVSYDKEGVKINSKDIKVDIKRDSL
jgi:hypothetical protein